MQARHDRKLIRNLTCAAAGLALISSAAVAQDFGATSTTGAVPPNRDTSLELKPLPFIASALPGIGAAGVAGERFINGNLAGVVEGSWMTADLSRRVREANDKSSTALPDRVNGYGANVGARYYGDGTDDSWYAGGKVGFARSEGDWEYHEEIVGKEVTSVVPGVEGGYRWNFNSGLLMRVGGNVGANVIVQENTDQGTASDDAVDEVDDITRAPLTANVDFGVGYSF